MQNAPEQFPAAKLHQYMASLPASIHHGLLLPNVLTPGLRIRHLGKAHLKSASFFLLYHLISFLIHGHKRMQGVIIPMHLTLEKDTDGVSQKVTSEHAHVTVSKQLQPHLIQSAVLPSLPLTPVAITVCMWLGHQRIVQT